MSWMLMPLRPFVDEPAEPGCGDVLPSSRIGMARGELKLCADGVCVD